MAASHYRDLEFMKSRNIRKNVPITKTGSITRPSRIPRSNLSSSFISTSLAILLPNC